MNEIIINTDTDGELEYVEYSRRNEEVKIVFPAGVYSLFYLKKGKGVIVLDFQETAINDGHLVLIKKNETAFCRFEKQDRVFIKIVTFNESILICPEAHVKLKELPALKNKEYSIYDVSEFEDAGYPELIIEKIKKEHNTEQRWQWNLIRIYLTEILISMSRCMIKRGNLNDVIKDEIVEKFQHLLEKNYKKHWSLEYYSRQLNVSQTLLSKKIRQKLGKSFVKTANEFIILEAKRRLFNTQKTVKEISYSLGFDDPAYFHRFFKKHSGLTPLEFRIKAAKKYN